MLFTYIVKNKLINLVYYNKRDSIAKLTIIKIVVAFAFAPNAKTKFRSQFGLWATTDIF